MHLTPVLCIVLRGVEVVRLILFLVGDGVAPKISSSTKLFVVRNKTLAISNAPKATHWASFLSFTTLYPT